MCEFLVFLLFLVLFGGLVMIPITTKVVDKASETTRYRLENADESEAKDFVSSQDHGKQRSGGFWIGAIERILFFLAMLLAPAVIVGWFALKAASKWAEWQHIVAVTKQGNLSLGTRRDMGNYLFTRFIVGTGSNLVLAMLVAAILIKINESC